MPRQCNRYHHDIDKGHSTDKSNKSNKTDEKTLRDIKRNGELPQINFESINKNLGEVSNLYAWA